MTTRIPVRTRRGLLHLAASVGAVALLASGCGGAASGNEAATNDDGSVDMSKVTLIVGDQRATSTKVLLEAAGLDDTDYAIDFKEFTSGPPMLEALGAGAIHVGYVGNTPPIIAAGAGQEFKIVQASSYGGEGDAVLVPEGSDITSVEQLKGKTVAVAQGSSANYNLLAQLEKAGLSWGDITVSNLQPADALAAFGEGHVDAWAVWEPYTSQAELTAGGTVIADGRGVVNGLSFQVASDAALEDPATAEALGDYLERVTEAQIWASEHPDEWSKVWAEQTGLTPEVTLHAVKKRPLRILPVDDEIAASEQEIADSFAAEKLLPNEVTMADYVDGRYNDALAAYIDQTAD